MVLFDLLFAMYSSISFKFAPRNILPLEEMYSYNIFLLCIWFHWVIYSIGQDRRFRMKRKCFMKMGLFLPLRAGACLT